MSYFYSPSNNLIYSRAFHQLTADAVEVSDSDYRRLVAEAPPNKVLAADSAGRPTLVDPPAPDLAAIKGQLWERIKAERDRRTLTGGYQVNGYWLHSDQLSRDQQLKLMLAGENVPRVAWKTMTGEFVQMTPELAGAIVLASSESDITIFAAAEAHRAAMLASPDPAAYDYSQGWPMTYDEWAAQQEA